MQRGPASILHKKEHSGLFGLDGVELPARVAGSPQQGAAAGQRDESENKRYAAPPGRKRVAHVVGNRPEDEAGHEHHESGPRETQARYPSGTEDDHTKTQITAWRYLILRLSAQEACAS